MRSRRRVVGVTALGLGGVLLLPIDAVYGWSLLAYMAVGLTLVLRCRRDGVPLRGFWGLTLATICCVIALDVVHSLLTLESAGRVEVYSRTVLSALSLVLVSICGVIALGPGARRATAGRLGGAANLLMLGLGIDVWRTLLQHDFRWEASSPLIVGLRAIPLFTVVYIIRRAKQDEAPAEGLSVLAGLGAFSLAVALSMLVLQLGAPVRVHSALRILAGGIGLAALGHVHVPLVGRLLALDRGPVPLSDWRRLAFAAVMLNPLVAWLILYGYRSRLAVSVGVVALAALWLAAIAATSLNQRARSPRSAGGRAAVSRADVSAEFGQGESKAAGAPANVLIEQLAGALIDDQLELHYQPVVDVRSAEVVGAEALLRWRQPDQSTAAPAHVLHLARIGGISRQLEAWILLRAFRDAAAIADRLGTTGYLGVNITAAQLERPGFSREVLSFSADLGLPEGFVVLELTEYEALIDWDAARATMDELRSHGFHFALDDYGTGVANLQALTELSFDVVKLDRTFVIGSHLPAKAKMLDESFRAVQTLGVKVVLEGVEDPTATGVADLVGQVDLAQGFAYGHPMPLPDLERLLETPTQ